MTTVTTAPIVDGKRAVTFTFYIAEGKGLDKLFSTDAEWSDDFSRAIDAYMLAIETECIRNQ